MGGQCDRFTNGYDARRHGSGVRVSGIAGDLLQISGWSVRQATPWTWRRPLGGQRLADAEGLGGCGVQPVCLPDHGFMIEDTIGVWEGRAGSSDRVGWLMLWLGAATPHDGKGHASEHAST